MLYVPVVPSVAGRKAAPLSPRPYVGGLREDVVAEVEAGFVQGGPTALRVGSWPSR